MASSTGPWCPASALPSSSARGVPRSRPRPRNCSRSVSNERSPASCVAPATHALWKSHVRGSSAQLGRRVAITAAERRVDRRFDEELAEGEVRGIGRRGREHDFGVARDGERASPTRSVHDLQAAHLERPRRVDADRQACLDVVVVGRRSSPLRRRRPAGRQRRRPWGAALPTRPGGSRRRAGRSRFPRRRRCRLRASASAPGRRADCGRSHRRRRRRDTSRWRAVGSASFRRARQRGPYAGTVCAPTGRCTTRRRRTSRRAKSANWRPAARSRPIASA